MQDAPEAQSPRVAGIWWPVLWFGLLIGLIYFHVLYQMVVEWGTMEEMGHGFFVPAMVGYVVWQRREALQKVPLAPHWSGWVLVVLSFVALVAGQLGAEFFVMRVGFLMALVGVLLAFCGWPMVKELAFPLLLLPFMIRIPLFVYSQITLPLQLLSSSLAESGLSLIGIPVFRDGNVLELASQKLSVVEACSGIRSLLSLGFLSLIYGYLVESRTWLRVALFILTIPIAISANASRIVMTGILSEWNRDYAEGIYHIMEGWVVFVVAMVALVFTHRLILMALSIRSRRHSHVPA
ncbi:exosortase/archaeosortase family protein [Paludibaculum fermentans]|uniref:exosortase/archaeosortase family protein n=1 Tax=Paludibaculum fermentans TaxID=1473598 RepID=UPI003EC0EEAA